MLDKHRAAERIRENQQGRGRPIVALKANDQQFVAVGNTLYHSPTWRTFPDFLSDYLKRIIDPSWGNAELQKPFEQRHPLMQWYDGYCRYQQSFIKKPGEIHSAPATGVAVCYMGVAYSLYLLNHNVELQERLIRRLKDPANFQGAYYELVVANILIRAGFTLALEDETDGTAKHCEFSATSTHTGKKYWVEAKMRSVAGLLGKTTADGTTDANPISRLIPHLNDALAKPAADERLIFIDLNAPPEPGASMKPEWGERAARRLEQYEKKELTAGIQAYVFVTNMSYHRALDETPIGVGMPFGLGMPDFNRPGFYRLSEAYRLKQKHIDAHQIGEALSKYPQLPQTFDGRMPSEAFDRSTGRIMIGETYMFDDGNGGAVVGTVTTATVSEPEQQAYIGVSEPTGPARILRRPMSADELADYKANPDAFFGKIVPVSKRITDKFEFFEWLMSAHKTLSREALLKRLAAWPNFEQINDASDEELLALYCEGMVGAFEASGFKTGEKP